MRRAVLLIGGLVLVGGCSFGSDGGSSAEPAGRCMATSNNPWRGVAAITEDYRVRVWDTETNAYTQLPMVGDDPRSDRVEGDFNVVETVAVHPTSCRTFVGTCCEPVAGVTYYDVTDNEDEWQYVFGHYPAVSPDGERVAFSAYEDLSVAPIDAPDQPSVTVRQPAADEATIYDMAWLDDSTLVLLGVAVDGTYLWRVDLAEKKLETPVLVTDAVTTSSGDVWSVGMAGVDSDGMLVVRAPVGTEIQLQHRSAADLKVASSETLDQGVRSYRISGDRAVRVTDSGILQVRASGEEEWVTTGSATDRYLWAG